MNTFATPRLAAALLGLLASIAIAAGCGGGGYGSSSMPGQYAGPSPSPAVPVIHINFFGSANGVFSDPTFGNVSGFTQQSHAQVLGLSPGAHVTITNSDSVSHTLNVFAAYPTPGPQSTAAAPNGGVLAPGYQTGVLAPGQSTAVLTVTNTPGNLYILCGIHFGSGMQDGIVVNVNATPGPQATGSGGTCHGYGC
jgi:plastocyanin